MRAEKYKIFPDEQVKERCHNEQAEIEKLNLSADELVVNARAIAFLALNKTIEEALLYKPLRISYTTQDGGTGFRYVDIRGWRLVIVVTPNSGSVLILHLSRIIKQNTNVSKTLAEMRASLKSEEP